MRNDNALLLDMLIAARKIQKFTAALTQDAFYEAEIVHSAAIREFQVLGEAARMVSEETKTRYSEIAWPVIAGMRNRMIHEYFTIDLTIVWDTIQYDIPTIILQLEKIVPSANTDESD